MFFQTKFLIPKFSGNPPDEKKIRAFEKLMHKGLDDLENIWLASSDKDFLATKEISFADILACCELEQPKMAQYNPFESRPKLKSWYERVKNATNPYYDEAHVILNKIVQKTSQSKL
jgi:glutathione S-transferase